MEFGLYRIKMERYTAYNDSGVQGLGEIPYQWKMLSNKYIFKLKKNQVGKKSTDYVLLSLTLNGVIKRDMENPQGKFPAEFDTYQEVKKGDFIFCLFDVEETPRGVGLSNIDGMITGAYTVMESSDNFDKNFLYYFYLNLDSDKRLRPLYTGLRNIISKEKFFSYKTFVPPLPEQTAIAAFLDRKTALIDQAIHIKQKQIDLLKERRQILIHKAVTRGLNPNVKMKDSGVEWIGEIPEHWEVKRIKHVSSKIVDGAHFTPTYVDKGIPFLRVTDLSDLLKENIDWGNVKYIPEREHKELIKRANPHKGDILLSKNGTIGITKVIDWDEEFSFFVSLCLIKPLVILNPYYFSLFFNSPLVDQQITYGSSRTSVTNLHLEKIKELIILLPPLEEQSLMVAGLKKITDPFDNLHRNILIQIEHLKEYKATLINSAVTGKIKVC